MPRSSSVFSLLGDKMKMRIGLELHLELLKMRHTIVNRAASILNYNNTSVILGH